MIRIERAPAYATVQDSGRRGFLASGVPRAGAMDIPALSTLNAMLGNDARCAVIEWALTGGEMTFERDATFAIGGASAEAKLGGRAIEPWQAHNAAAGDRLSISAPASGRFVYFAFAGGIDTPQVMRSRSTYVPGEFGGVAGRRLRTGDILGIIAPAKRKLHQVSDPLPIDLRPPFEKDTIGYVPRGEAELASKWMISSASDRTGYRLESSTPGQGASMTSEPVCPGVIQLPPDGQPIVLMADAPTIGGYRIAGAVISADLGVLAQRMPGAVVTLERTTVERAQRELERLSERLGDVREWSLG